MADAPFSYLRLHFMLDAASIELLFSSLACSGLMAPVAATSKYIFNTFTPDVGLSTSPVLSTFEPLRQTLKRKKSLSTFRIASDPLGPGGMYRDQRGIRASDPIAWGGPHLSHLHPQLWFHPRPQHTLLVPLQCIVRGSCKTKDSSAVNGCSFPTTNDELFIRPRSN